MMLKRLFPIALFLVLPAASPAAHALMLHDSSRLAMYSAEAEPESRNSHPARIETDQLLDALSRVRARSGETGEVIELFPKKNREQMAKRLARELRRIEPDEELHLISFRHIGSLLSSKRHASAARVFMERGRLNLIFGQIDLLFSEFRDPDRPLPPMGSRKRTEALKGRIIRTEGVTFVDGRNDWVAIDLDRDAHSPPAAAPAVKETGQAPGERSPKAAGKPEEKSIEEKLQILKNLRDKDLITEQEYTDKKRQILDSF